MRSSSYIKGLDDILCGGFILPSTVLVAGTAGSGKTNLCLQSLFHASKRQEKCAYISLLAGSREKIISTTSMLGFFDEHVIASGMLEIHSIGTDIIAKGDFSIFEYIAENVLNTSPARVVIDTITILEVISSTFEEREFRGCELRTFMQNLFLEFEERGILLMITGEVLPGSITVSPWSYMADTILHLGRTSTENGFERHLEVIKTRGSDFVQGKHSFILGQEGICMLEKQI
jgi:circadian clock protein KaiC